MRGFIVAACLMSTIAMPAISKQPLNLEITPLVGYRFGGNFNTVQEGVDIKIKLAESESYGFLTSWSYDRNRQSELLISHNETTFSQTTGFSASDTDLSITYIHIGGNVPISDGVVPAFVTGGFGLAHFAPKEDEMNNETRFSANIGLATRLPITDHFSLRFDSRIYATFFNSNSAIFCNTSNCAVYLSSDVWFQSEVNAGLTYSF